MESNDPNVWEIAGTIVTLLAVLVALFGPQFWNWFRRPRLKAIDDPKGHIPAWTTGRTGDIGGTPILFAIRNEGREQASDVQVFVTMSREAETELGFVEFRHVQQSPIPFLHREGGAWTVQHSVGIPWGFTRPLQLVGLDGTSLALVHATGEDRKRIPGGAYTVVLDIVGSNFRVTRFAGALDVKGVEAEWITFPKRVRYEPDPMPKSLLKKIRDKSHPLYPGP